MRALLWIGVVVLLLGIAALFVEVPRRETSGIKAGDVTLGVEIRHKEKLPAYVAGIMIAGGIGMMIAGGRHK